MQYDQMTQDVKQQMMALQANYENGLLGKIDSLEEAWCAILLSGSTPEAMRDIHRISHSLAGSGKMFGYPGISTSAQAIERILEQALADNSSISDTDAKKVSNLIQHLRQVALDEPTHDVSVVENSGADPDASYQGRTVLVVDDDPNMRSLVKIRLQAFGLKVISAFDGEEGYARALAENPDLIITDHVMPGTTGIDMVAKIRRNQLTQDIPIIVMTAQKFDGERNYALERDYTGRCGALAYLEKPLVFEDLLQQIKRVISL